MPVAAGFAGVRRPAGKSCVPPEAHWFPIAVLISPPWTHLLAGDVERATVDASGLCTLVGAVRRSSTA
jgi:hypothetical protein